MNSPESHRHIYAAAALQGLLANQAVAFAVEYGSGHDHDKVTARLARAAFDYADAMVLVEETYPPIET